MTIAEDASTPAAVSTTTTGPVTVTTAAFTPPSGSLLVAMGSSGWSNATTAVPTISDSTGGTWTTAKSVQGTISPGDGGSCVIAYRYLSSAPGSMTVSCHTDANNKGGTFLKAAVLTGCSSAQTGASASINVTTSSTTWCVVPITTTTAGSWLYGTVNESQGNSTLTAGTATAFVTQGGGTNPWTDNTNFISDAAIKASAATVSPGATSLRVTSSVSLFGTAVAFEVLPGSTTTNVSAPESGSAADSAAIGPAAAQTGSFVDAGGAAPNGVEVAVAVDGAVAAAHIFDDEPLTATDSAGVTGVVLPVVTDTASSADVAVAAVNASAADTGGGVDTATANVSVLTPAADTSTGVEAATVTVVSDEPLTSVEGFTITATVGDDDQGALVEAEELFVQFAGRPRVRVAHVNPEYRTLRVPKLGGVPRG